jgi:hypothetical protein
MSMRTTLVLGDQLMRAVRRRAAETGETLFRSWRPRPASGCEERPGPQPNSNWSSRLSGDACNPALTWPIVMRFWI